MKKILTMFMISMVLIGMSSVYCSAATYSDISGHWAKDSIERVEKFNILKGYKDNTFQPGKTITRAELSSVLNRMLGYKVQSDREYKDVKKTSWYYNDVAALIDRRIISGKDGKFYPDEELTREEAVYMIGKAFGIYNTSIFSTKPYYNDEKDISPYALRYVKEMKAEYGFDGYPDDTFRPKNKITRAEVVFIIDCMVRQLINKPGDYDITAQSSILVTCPDVKINLNCTGGPRGITAYGTRITVAPTVSGIGAVNINTGTGNSAEIFLIGTSKEAVKASRSSTIFFTDINNVRPINGNDKPFVHRMGIAMGGMLTYLNNKHTKSEMYTEFGSEDPDMAKMHLNGDSWGIQSRKELISQVISFNEELGHNDMYLEEVKEAKAISDSELKKYTQGYSDGYMFNQLKNWDKKWGDTGIITWDLFRVSNLVQWGYSAGYLTYDEALALVEPSAIKVSQNFSSWDEAYDNYLDGYAWWSRSDISKGRPREAEYQYIKVVYWDLFDDDMFSVNYTPQYTKTYNALKAEIE